MHFNIFNNHFGRSKIILLSLAASLYAHAETTEVNQNDSVRIYGLDEVVITSSTRETNPLQSLPGAATLISPQQVQGMNLVGIKDLSAVVPNFFIPDYGSRMTVPVYVRGFGERSTGQTIGLYVDEAPYPDKSAFDFNFPDIQRIEALRGPQGTLFGRNAMAGIIRIYTHSPLEFETVQATLTGGSQGLFRANALVSKTIDPKTGISVSGYYDRNDGYFTNQYTGRIEDESQTAGGRIRIDRKLGAQWTAQLTGGYDFTRQGAFPYGVYADGKVEQPNYNDEGSYTRKVANGNFNLHYKGETLLFNASTSYQYLNDDAQMDVDYSPASTFTLRQKQKLHSFTEEMTLKSAPTGSDYQWSFGLYGFSNNMKTNALTTMGIDGVNTIMKPMFDALFQQIHANNPNAPEMSVNTIDSRIPIPGQFSTPAVGGAIFHQSTINNLIVDGLSLTAGIRLDYEKTKLEYLTQTDINMNLNVKMTMPPITVQKDTLLTSSLEGSEQTSFTRIIPKIALKYDLNANNYVYASVSNGYKAGGYNIQSFADLTQYEMRRKYSRSDIEINVNDSVFYSPEYSWNYEAGIKGEWVENLLYGELTVFYMDVHDIQLTEFVNSGQGRMLSNAGRASSKGIELSLAARLNDNWSLTADYGYNHAVFGKNEGGEDFEGNFLPYAPRQTLAAGVVYNKKFRQGSFIDRFQANANYNAAGKIYWTAANDVSQPFYGLLNLRFAATKGAVELALWSKNTLDTDYAAFYFESMGRSLAQQGRPFRMGVDLSIKF